MTGANKLDEANQSGPPGIVRVDRLVRPVAEACRDCGLLLAPGRSWYCMRCVQKHIGDD
jgi:hypothetical protein